MIKLQGVSLDPLNKPNANEQVRITSIHSGSGVNSGISAIIKTNQTGEYSADLIEGTYLVEVLQSGSREWIVQGNVLVSPSTPRTVDLVTLVNEYSYIAPEPR